jgi:hypothetical protein
VAQPFEQLLPTLTRSPVGLDRKRNKYLPGLDKIRFFPYLSTLDFSA